MPRTSRGRGSILRIPEGARFSRRGEMACASGEGPPHVRSRSMKLGVDQLMSVLFGLAVLTIGLDQYRPFLGSVGNFSDILFGVVFAVGGVPWRVRIDARRLNSLLRAVRALEPVLWGGVLFTAGGAIASLGSEDPAGSWRVTLKHFGMLCVWLPWATVAIERYLSLNRAFVLYVGGICLIALATFADLLLGTHFGGRFVTTPIYIVDFETIAEGVRYGGPTGHPVTLGYISAIGVLLCLAIVVTGPWRRAPAPLLALVACGSAMMVSGSRAAFLGVLVGAVLIVALANRAGRKRMLLVAGSCLALLAVVSRVANLGPQLNPATRLLESLQPRRSFEADWLRVHDLPLTERLLAHDPWTGDGRPARIAGHGMGIPCYLVARLERRARGSRHGARPVGGVRCVHSHGYGRTGLGPALQVVPGGSHVRDAGRAQAVVGVGNPPRAVLGRTLAHRPHPTVHAGRRRSGRIRIPPEHPAGCVARHVLPGLGRPRRVFHRALPGPVHRNGRGVARVPRLPARILAGPPVAGRGGVQPPVPRTPGFCRQGGPRRSDPLGRGRRDGTAGARSRVRGARRVTGGQGQRGRALRLYSGIGRRGGFAGGARGPGPVLCLGAPAGLPIHHAHCVHPAERVLSGTGVAARGQPPRGRARDRIRGAGAPRARAGDAPGSRPRGQGDPVSAVGARSPGGGGAPGGPDGDGRQCVCVESGGRRRAGVGAGVEPPGGPAKHYRGSRRRRFLPPVRKPLARQ